MRGKNIKYHFNSDILKSYFNEINSFPLLKKKEERELLLKYHLQKDENAKEKLFNHNLRLVLNAVFNNYYVKFTNDEEIALDLIQEGNMGLLEGIEMFDVNQNTRLSTFATYRINSKITRYFKKNNNLVKIPEYIYDEISKIEKFKNDFLEEYGKKPSYFEIEKKFDNSKKKKVFFLKSVTNFFNQNMNFEIKEKDLLDSMDIQYELERIELKKKLFDIIDKNLKSIEKIAIIETFGLLGEPLTGKEIVEKYNNNFSINTIIEAKSRALKKLSKLDNSILEELKLYIYN